MPPIRRKLLAAAIAAANALLVAAGTVVAIKKASRGEEFAVSAGLGSSPTTPPPTRDRPAKPAPAKVAGRPSVAEVQARPWPARAKAGGTWKAHLEGSGPLLRIWAPTTVHGPAPATLTSSDGAVWNVAELRTPLRFERLTAVNGAMVNGAVPYGGLTLQGRFVAPDGGEVAQLTLSPSAILSVPATRLVTDAAIARGVYGYQDNGLSVEVAGSIEASGLGKSWSGLVGSIEADSLKVTATWHEDGAGWAVVADAASARQLWVDGWPVVDTVLQATSGYDGGPHSCHADCSVRLRYGNGGAATAQIMEVEAVGTLPYAVDLGINATNNHDAGLGVRRGGVVVGFGRGRPIDSHLPPGDRFDRGLTHTPGASVTLIIRGNFPEVRVTLAIPAAAVRSAA